MKRDEVNIYGYLQIGTYQVRKNPVLQLCKYFIDIERMFVVGWRPSGRDEWFGPASVFARHRNILTVTQ